MQPHSTSANRAAFTIVELICVIAIIGILIALLFPAVRSSRGAARNAHCENNLRRIGMSIHDYAEQHQDIPHAYTVDSHGKPLHSWRTLILPNFGYRALHAEIDVTAAWNSSTNQTTFSKPVSEYQCPSFEIARNEIAANHTLYKALISEQSPLHPQGSSSDFDSFDSPNHAVMVMEANLNESIPWGSPLDADIEALFGINGKSQLPHEGRMNLLFSDGSVRMMLNDSTTEERVRMISPGIITDGSSQQLQEQPDEPTNDARAPTPAPPADPANSPTPSPDTPTTHHSPTPSPSLR